MRNLQLGVTLVRKANLFELDLSSPSDHKTAAVFGPSRTTLNAKVSALVDEYTALADLDTASKHYLFYKGDDASAPYSPSAWTKTIKSLFKRHSGVPLAPKELRASFVTFLKSGNHSDTTLRSAAVALRHSSKTQDSHAYNKGKSDRMTAAAVKVAAEFAATFKARGKGTAP